MGLGVRMLWGWGPPCSGAGWATGAPEDPQKGPHGGNSGVQVSPNRGPRRPVSPTEGTPAAERPHGEDPGIQVTPKTGDPGI